MTPSAGSCCGWSWPWWYFVVFGVVWGVFGAGPVLGLLIITLIPASVTIAILRYQLLDIRLVVSAPWRTRS